jgi:hypothetical protein
VGEREPGKPVPAEWELRFSLWRTGVQARYAPNTLGPRC